MHFKDFQAPVRALLCCIFNGLPHSMCFHVCVDCVHRPIVNPTTAYTTKHDVNPV